MSETADADDSTHDERKQRYKRLLSVVEHNTTQEQPPGVTAEALKRFGTENLGLALGQVQLARDAAIEAGDLVRWSDHEGTIRYSLLTRESLNRIVEYEADTGEPNRRLIGRLNVLADEVDPDSGSYPTESDSDTLRGVTDEVSE